MNVEYGSLADATFSSSIKCNVEKEFDYFDSADPLASYQNVAQKYLTKKQDELEQKQVVSDGFEQKHTLDYYRVGKREAKKRRQAERRGTAGQNWFDMKAPELTDEIKRDLEVIQMRKALFKDHQYKRRATDKAPEHFQIGRVVEGNADYYSSRLNRKQRANTIVEELLKDAAFKKRSKQRYERIAMANADKKKAKAMRKKLSKKRDLIRKKVSKDGWKNRAEQHKLDSKKNKKDK